MTRNDRKETVDRAVSPGERSTALATDGGTTAEHERVRTTSGLEPNVAGALAYALGWLTGLYFLVTEEEDEFVRFHAAQSVVVFGALTVVWIVISIVLQPLVLSVGGAGLWGILGTLTSLVSLAGLGLWLGLMYVAYQGRRYELPVAGDVANDLLSSRGRPVERDPR